MPWKLTVRSGPRVDRERFGVLEEALAELESRGRQLEQAAARTAVDLRYRRFEPEQQVVARLELAGPQRLLPSTHAGIDVRGDGSTRGYLGRLRRRVIEPRRGETAYQAVRRSLAPGASATRS